MGRQPAGNSRSFVSFHFAFCKSANKLCSVHTMQDSCVSSCTHSKVSKTKETKHVRWCVHMQSDNHTTLSNENGVKTSRMITAHRSQKRTFPDSFQTCGLKSRLKIGKFQKFAHLVGAGEGLPEQFLLNLKKSDDLPPPMKYSRLCLPWTLLTMDNSQLWTVSNAPCILGQKLCLPWTTLSTVDRGHHFSPYHGQSTKNFFFCFVASVG